MNELNKNVSYDSQISLEIEELLLFQRIVKNSGEMVLSCMAINKNIKTYLDKNECTRDQETLAYYKNMLEEMEHKNTVLVKTFVKNSIELKRKLTRVFNKYPDKKNIMETLLAIKLSLDVIKNMKQNIRSLEESKNVFVEYVGNNMDEECAISEYLSNLETSIYLAISEDEFLNKHCGDIRS